MPKYLHKVEIPIEWNVPDDIVARYASNMTVQRMENEYLISFFEVKPPIILGEPTEIESKLKTFKTMRANCVAQIIISKEKMPSIISALETNWKLNTEETPTEEDKK